MMTLEKDSYKKKKWGDKPYNSLDFYVKNTFGHKLYKVSLNGGMTCPNRDGTIAYGGCIFCSNGGSGDFSSSPLLSITEQIEAGKKLVSHKISQSISTNPKEATLKRESYIAYFQAFTNTYGEINYLREIFMEAIMHPEVAALSIATRPDCLGPQVLSLLKELNEIKPVWVELGLQTIHDKTASFIRRGYELSVFEEAVKNLDACNIESIVHLIIGLPGETKNDIIDSVTHVTTLPIHGIKLQLLHILEGTELASHTFPILTLEEYTDILITCIERIPPNVVIHRITGDGPKNILISPKWSGNKKRVLNYIHKEFSVRNTWQGRCLV